MSEMKRPLEGRKSLELIEQLRIGAGYRFSDAVE